jgi:hypothetical protein
MSRPLDVLFREVLTRYPVARRDEKFGRESSFWPLIAELKQALEAVPALAASKRAKVKVSFGQGGWAEVPNFALMDTRETERPSAGLYLVYLVRADASGLVLSLNQGSADLLFEAKGRVNHVLAARAAKVRGSPVTRSTSPRRGSTRGPTRRGASSPRPTRRAPSRVRRCWLRTWRCSTRRTGR